MMKSASAAAARFYRPGSEAECHRSMLSGLRAAQKQTTPALTPLKRTLILLLLVVIC